MNAKVFERTFQPLFGQPCWGLDFTRILSLSMNFGKPSLRIREPYTTTSKSEAVQLLAQRRRVTVRGEWWLSIYCCYWRLSLDNLPLATGSSSFRRIRLAMAQLTEQHLISVRVEPVSGATLFAFDLGCVLECRRFDRDSDAEVWMLYKPNGYVLSVHGNGCFRHQRGNDAEKRPMPIEENICLEM
ncbi:MAG: hypothetical protein HY040_01420 [Planctomycetes bacterium]|nr:hypothetical protein [Planctomycetota bacterium]